jgi:hypothetical protein
MDGFFGTACLNVEFFSPQAEFSMRHTVPPGVMFLPVNGFTVGLAKNAWQSTSVDRAAFRLRTLVLWNLAATIGLGLARFVRVNPGMLLKLSMAPHMVLSAAASARSCAVFNALRSPVNGL